MRRLSLAIPVLLLTACVSPPDAIAPVVADESTFLGLAVRQVSDLTDPLARAELYGTIARGYLEVADEESARSLVLTGLELARSAGATEESVRARLALAPVLAATGEDAALTAILDGALAYARDVAEPPARAQLLPVIVSAAQRSGEPARPFLRSTVDEVFVIEDPALRARALVDVARLYQQGTAALSVTGLIQQAIPAVRSIRAPYARAAFFAELAELAAATAETQLAQRMVENLRDELSAAPPVQTDAEHAQLLVVVRSLGSTGEIDFGREVAASIADPWYRTRALVSVARFTASRSARLDLLDRARRAATQIEHGARSVSARVEVGAGYLDANVPAPALEAVEAARSVVESDREVYARIEPAAEVARLLVRLDRIQTVRTLLLGAPDAYVRGAVAVRAAEQLIEDGRLGLADDFLTIALVSSDESTYLQDGLRTQVVSGFAQTGSVRLAIRTIERMDDEVLRARAVADLAVRTEPAGLVTPLYRADLASVLARR